MSRVGFEMTTLVFEGKKTVEVSDQAATVIVEVLLHNEKLCSVSGE
jgi:hypothetical protein